MQISMKNIEKWRFFAKKSAKIRKSFTKFRSNFEIGAVQRIANLVVLEKCCKMRIWVQKSASMQKRTSPLKFGDLAEKSGLNSVSNLSTKLPSPRCPALAAQPSLHSQLHCSCRRRRRAVGGRGDEAAGCAAGRAVAMQPLVQLTSQLVVSSPCAGK